MQQTELGARTECGFPLAAGPPDLAVGNDSGKILCCGGAGGVLFCV